ncbi:hypothetical protein [Marinitoga sp. 1155]|uniref:hypothetical protein n=1 Tax=Marinitoga sp. 1155 TaxID=1428448 RepID=UPI0006414CAC|nr:hypothetical protein [Marinitoga sp. 1155]KLO20953.1 hypothetical protein X274_11400 [Marinitoga sp. 1155]
MKKGIIIGLIIILILSLASCVKSIKVKTKPRIGVPVAATTISLDNYINIEESIKDILTGATVESVGGVQTIKYATGLNVDMSQSFEKIDAFSTSINQSISIPDIDSIDPIAIDIPSIKSLNEINVSVPDFDFTPQNINVNVPDLNPEPSNPDITVGEIDVNNAGIELPTIELSIPVAGTAGNGSSTSDKINSNGSFSKLVFSTGSLTLDVTNNDDSASVEVDGIITNPDNSVITSNILSLSTNSPGNLIFDLSDKFISDGATITLRATITSGSGNNGTLIADNLSFSAGTKIKAAEDIEFSATKNISQTIDPNMGTTSFSTITIDGTFNINIELPAEWQNVKTEFEATVLYKYDITKSIELTHRIFNSNSQLAFQSKSLPPNGSFEFTIDSTFTNTDNEKSNIDFTKSPTITITPEITVKKIEGVVVNNTQNINLPDDIESVSLSGGNISLNITDTVVSSIVAKMVYNDGTSDNEKQFELNNDGAILNMDNLVLTGKETNDATIIVEKLDLDFGNAGLNTSSLTANISIEKPAIISVTLNKSIKQRIDLPNDIENVKFKTGALNAALNTGSFTSITGVLETKNEDINLLTSAGKIAVDLSNKLLTGTDDATLNITQMTIDFSSNPLDFGNILSVSPTLDNLSISEATLTTNILQDINLPSEIKKVIFGSGNIEITLNNAEFMSISGTLTYDTNKTSMSVSSEGTALIDLTDLELGSPANITIDRVSIKSIQGLELGSQITANISLNNPKIKYAEVSTDENLNISNIQKIEFPAEAKDLLNSITFTGTSAINIDWNNELPVGINVSIKIPEFGIDDTFVMENSNTHEVSLTDKTIDLDNPLNFEFEASPANYDETNNIITINISNPSNYLTPGNTYTLSATINLDYKLDASVKPINKDIIPESDPLNFEIPISEDTTLTLNDIDIEGFNAKIIGTIPDSLVNENNYITLIATYTVNNTVETTTTDVVFDETSINKDITEFLKTVLKGENVYMAIKSSDLNVSLEDLSNFVFDFKIDLTIPLSFKLLKNENLEIIKIEGKDDILGRKEGDDESDLPLDVVIGNQGELVLHLKYDNTTGLTPGLKITGKNKNGTFLYEKDIELENGVNELIIKFTKDDIDKIINNNPYYIDFIGYIPPDKTQEFRSGGELKLNAWIEVVTDINADLLKGGE